MHYPKSNIKNRGSKVLMENVGKNSKILIYVKRKSRTLYHEIYILEAIEAAMAGKREFLSLALTKFVIQTYKSHIVHTYKN